MEEADTLPVFAAVDIREKAKEKERAQKEILVKWTA